MTAPLPGIPPAAFRPLLLRRLWLSAGARTFTGIEFALSGLALEGIEAGAWYARAMHNDIDYFYGRPIKVAFRDLPPGPVTAETPIPANLFTAYDRDAGEGRGAAAWRGGVASRDPGRVVCGGRDGIGEGGGAVIQSDTTSTNVTIVLRPVPRGYRRPRRWRVILRACGLRGSDTRVLSAVAHWTLDGVPFIADTIRRSMRFNDTRSRKLRRSVGTLGLRSFTDALANGRVVRAQEKLRTAGSAP